MGKTSIEWTEQTWNPVAGCSLVSPGCTNCYAMSHAARLLDRPGSHYEGTTKRVNGKPVWTGKIGIAPDSILLAPLTRKKPTMYFVNSMSDLFHEAVPDAVIDRVFAVMALSPQHTFQVLTKRAKRMREYCQDMATEAGRSRLLAACDAVAQAMHPHDSLKAEMVSFGAWFGQCLGDKPLPNVWLGVSTEDQARADERIPDLLATPAAVRFVSAEPLLSPIDFSPWLADNPVYEKQAKRRVCLSGSDERRHRNSPGRDDLAAAQEGVGPMAEEGRKPTLQASESGARQRGLSSGQDHAGWGESLRISAPAGLPSYDRADPTEYDSEPQGWTEKAQSPEQPRTGDKFGAANPRDKSSEGGARLQSGRRSKFDGNSDYRASGRNQEKASIGRGVGSNCEGFWGHVPDNIENIERRPTLSWVICGGESGPGARPMHPDWARSIRDQCAAAGTAFFLKQWGEWIPCLTDDYSDGQGIRVSEDCAASAVFDSDRRFKLTSIGAQEFWAVGKARAGRLLDGVEHNGMPRVRP
jgi:protein gp37